MHCLRTPEGRFDVLPDYPWAPRYVEVDAGDASGDRLRVHYVDDGPEDAAETVLLLHGEPSWSYLYRTVIPPLVAAGHRCVAPDLVGFGRSDKPTPRSEYTYQRHVDWLAAVVFDQLDLDGITLVCQDWGGLLGLRLVAEHPNGSGAWSQQTRSCRLVTATPERHSSPGAPSVRKCRRCPIGRIVQGGTTSDLPPEVVAAYDAPFPDESYKEGARQFPVLVPAAPDDPAAEPNRRAWESLRTVRQALPLHVQRPGPGHGRR